MQRYDEALEAVDAALKLSPNDTEYHSHREQTLWDLGRFEDALVEYDSMIRIQPDRALNHGNKSVLLVKLKRYQEALQELELATNLDPDEPNYRYRKAYTLYLIGHYEEAFKEGLAILDVLDGRQFISSYLIEFAEISALVDKGNEGMMKVDEVISMQKPNMEELCEYLDMGISTDISEK